jgi:short-chain fatty acids transporter
MLAKLGSIFADNFRKWLPDSFIFAILLTFIAGVMAFFWVDASIFQIIKAWFGGFFNLLAFAMQMVLILATGYAIAISPPASKGIDWLAAKTRTPAMVYVIVTGVGCIFSMISWGWVVLTAVLGRELAIRVKKVDYRLLAACIYTSILPWHGGLSGSVPLLINTPDNFLIKAKILTETIPTTITLTGPMNIVVQLLLLISLPLLMVLMKPSEEKVMEYKDLREAGEEVKEVTVAEEAAGLRLPFKNLSDGLNNSLIIQIVISIMGLWYLVWHFATKGFDINLNIMIFCFIVIGLLCHTTPVRYGVAMKRSCANVSGIILQFPFYAGIMGIMVATGLAKAIALWIAGAATVATYPFISFVIGSSVNMFVPSGGGEWAVVGPTIVEAAKELGASMAPEQLTDFIAKAAMAQAYGDACTNMIQPFWTLAFMPVVAAGVKLQARDFMGYTAISCVWSAIIFAICVTWIPV